jgi:hypothetical protein
VDDKVPSANVGVRAAQFNRSGAIIGVPLMMAICATCNTNAHAQEISVRQIQENSYELVLTNQSKLDEREAQAYIAGVAVKLCGGLSPVLGKYRFESNEALGPGVGVRSREPTPFRFAQEVSCVPVSLTAPAHGAQTPASPEESERARAEVTRLSEDYFRLLAAKKFDTAYSQMREGAIGQDKATWERDKQSFQVLAGDPIAISIVKLTVYDNPPEAPEPGLYVAADFMNAYENVPYECGYLMWHRRNGGTFGITRTEVGHVTKGGLERIPEAQRPELLQKLRCVVSAVVAEPSRICALAGTRAGLVKHAVKVEPDRYGNRVVAADFDLDGSVDSLKWNTTGSASIIPADNSTLTLSLTSSVKSVELEQQRLYVVKFDSRYFVVTSWVETEQGPWHKEVFSLSREGIKRICSFSGKGHGQ